LDKERKLRQLLEKAFDALPDGRAKQIVTIKGIGKQTAAVLVPKVCVEGKHLRKHPDRRVQRAVQAIFDLFDRSASVYDLLQRLWHRGVKLPAPGPAEEPTVACWVDPTYDRVLAMLENPKYAGAYAYPLHRYVTETDGDGPTRRRIVKVPPGEWDVEIRDHHPAYISWAQYEENQKKIAMNANRFAPRAGGAPLSGQALLVGLVRCRSCDHQMAVRYRSSGAIVYACQRGRRQREALKTSQLDSKAVQHAVRAIQTHATAPLPDDPKQLNLFRITDSHKGAS